MLSAIPALAPLELLPELLELFGIVEDVGDIFLSRARRIVARLGFFQLGCLDAAVLDPAAQLVDGQAGPGLSGGNGIKTGTKTAARRVEGVAVDDPMKFHIRSCALA